MLEIKPAYEVRDVAHIFIVVGFPLALCPWSSCGQFLQLSHELSFVRIMIAPPPPSSFLHHAKWFYNQNTRKQFSVIRGLALGTLNDQTRNQFMTREFRMALALSGILSVAGFARAIFFRTPFPEALAVTMALAMIVFSSVCLGAILPLVLEFLGVDPAHSSTTIQGKTFLLFVVGSPCFVVSCWTQLIPRLVWMRWASTCHCD
jgi:hypothetical protein